MDPLSSKRFRLPLIVLILTALLLIGLQVASRFSKDISNLNMVKIGTCVVSAVILTIWAFRKSGWSKRYVLTGLIVFAAMGFASFKLDSMSGYFFPILKPRDWVLNTFFGGSVDRRLEEHRQRQGRGTSIVDLTPQPRDWPDFRGPNRDGVAEGPALSGDWEASPPHEVWRQPVGGGYAAFATANGFLITIEQRRNEEVVVCYEASTGKEIWTRGWPTLFAESLGGDGPRATPTIAQGDVFAYGAKGRLVRLDGKTGEELWSVETLTGNKNIQWAMSGSPLVVGELVIVNPGAQTEEAKGSAVRAYDRQTGNLVWQAGNRAAGYASPQLATLQGVPQVLIFDNDGLGGYELQKGTELWRFRWPTYMGINVAQPLVLNDQEIVVCSDYSGEATGATRLSVTKTADGWTAKEIWKNNRVMKCKFTSPVRKKNEEGDFAYGLSDGIFECIDLKTGKSKWKDDRRARVGEAYGHGQVVLSGDLLIVLTEYGELVLIEANPNEFKELGRIQALEKKDKTWNTPTLVDGKIYIRNAEEMACYDLKGK